MNGGLHHAGQQSAVRNICSVEYEEERAQDRALWYTMPKWNEFRNYILEGYSLGPVSEERSKPFQQLLNMYAAFHQEIT